MRQLCIVKFYVYITSVCYGLGVFQRLRKIRKEFSHLLLAFYIVLTPGVAHTVFIVKLFSGLYTEQYVMRLCIIWICVVTVIRYYKRYIKLF